MSMKKNVLGGMLFFFLEWLLDSKSVSQRKTRYPDGFVAEFGLFVQNC